MAFSNHVLTALMVLCVGMPVTMFADDGAVQVGSEIADVRTLIGEVFPAHDSLDIGDEPSADARDCLDGLCWVPGDFAVACEPSSGIDCGDVLIRFASPVSSGDIRNDRVAMEWYVAKDEQGHPRSARAVVVIHESGRGMTVGRMFARGLRDSGLHAFMLQLPFYGERRSDGQRPKSGSQVTMMRQAITDVRRARDAVAALPLVDTSHIALQGTSLGGLVSATTAGLDRGYDSVFLMLAGGELYDLIQNGKRDAAKVRQELEKMGLRGEELKSLARTIEPTRVAHRMDPQRTWLFSGVFDTVVPPKNSAALATAAGLDQSHHIRMLANHYSGIVYFPFILHYIHDQIVLLDRRESSRTVQDRAKVVHSRPEILVLKAAMLFVTRRVSAGMESHCGM